MKKELKIKLICVFLCSIVIGAVLTVGYIIADDMIFRMLHKSAYSEGTINIKSSYIEVEILEIKDNNIIVRPTSNIPEFFTYSPNYKDRYAFLHTDRLQINLENIETVCDLEIGKIVNIIYRFVDGTIGENPIILNTVERIEEVEDWENIILYNGRRYNRVYLHADTLKWLEMSKEERDNFEYYPWDLVNKGCLSLSNEILDWGLIANVENVTPTGLILVFKQEDFIPTTLNDNWQLSTDGYFRISKLDGYKEKSVNLLTDILGQEIIDDCFKVQKIENNAITKIDISWEYTYGKLSKGEYCLKQKIKVLKGPNYYAWRDIWIPFMIE